MTHVRADKAPAKSGGPGYRTPHPRESLGRAPCRTCLTTWHQPGDKETCAVKKVILAAVLALPISANAQSYSCDQFMNATDTTKYGECSLMIPFHGSLPADK